MLSFKLDFEFLVSILKSSFDLEFRFPDLLALSASLILIYWPFGPVWS